MDKQTKTIIGGLIVALVVGAFLAYKRPVIVNVNVPEQAQKDLGGTSGGNGLLNYSATSATSTEVIYAKYGGTATSSFIKYTNDDDMGEALIQVVSTTTAAQTVSVALRTSNDGKIFYPINYSYVYGVPNTATSSLPLPLGDVSYIYTTSVTGTSTFAFRFEPTGAYTMFVVTIGTSTSLTSGGQYRLTVGTK